MHLQLPRRTLDLSEPRIMGVLNVTPDSFSDGGRYLDLDAALARAREMQAEGAVIIDVGGESSRPGAQPVSEAEELDRVASLIARVSREIDCIVSVDTTKPVVMAAACGAGAEMINDITALGTAGAMEVVRRHEVAACLMHMQGEPRSMQSNPQYQDVVSEVRSFLSGRIEACFAAGISRERLLVDPGFGFGKTLPHNLQMLAHINRFADLGCPVLIGVSRKSMFQQMFGSEVADRLAPALAAASLAVARGVRIVRTHDVKATFQAVQLAFAATQSRHASAWETEI